MLSSDIVHAIKDLGLFPGSDRMYSWKDSKKHKDDCLVIAKVGSETDYQKEDLISRIMTSSMYELLL
jgi:hypothetical protein